MGIRCAFASFEIINSRFNEREMFGEGRFLDDTLQTSKAAIRSGAQVKRLKVGVVNLWFISRPSFCSGTNILPLNV